MVWKRIIDNKMRYHGEIDTDKKVIRINKSKKKNKKKGEVLDTILHEETHRKHPNMHEKNVVKTAKHLMKSLSDSKKRKLYSLYK